MGDFLYYDVYGGFVFYLPAAVICFYVGWRVSLAILEPRGLNRKTIRAVSIPIAVVLFILLASSMNL